ncbi:MAG: MBL fold metallo-hydrolase, partial [Rhodobacteraceae bacterium]|nr:MBL fold metallo-hydrolase [Paracoccaceae bacterium]
MSQQPALAVIPGDKRDDDIAPQPQRLRITVLGCGGAGGVPSISDGWGACNPANPRNFRRRASILVQYGQTTVLVDASPDARGQLLDAGIKRLDGVLFTHAHADHIH